MTASVSSTGQVLFRIGRISGKSHKSKYIVFLFTAMISTILQQKGYNIKLFIIVNENKFLLQLCHILLESLMD